MHILLHHILRGVERVRTLSDILDNGSADTRFFLYFPKCRLLILFSCFHSALRQNPALILILVILVENQNLTAKYHHTSTARCFYHCNSSCPATHSASLWCVQLDRLQSLKKYKMIAIGFSITRICRSCKLKFCLLLFMRPTNFTSRTTVTVHAKHKL